MEYKIYKKVEIKQIRKLYFNLTGSVCIVGIIAILFSPTILITILITVVCSALCYTGVKKIKELDSRQQRLY